MILGITNIGNGELAVIGLGMVGLYLIGHAGRRLIDLWIDHMRHHGELELLDEYAGFDHDPASDFARHADDAQRLADAGREPDWQGKTPPPGYLPIHITESTVQPDDPATFATGGLINQPGPLLPGERGCDFVVPIHGELPPETEAETSHPRHSADDTVTELFPVVVEEDAPADETVGAS